MVRIEAIAAVLQRVDGIPMAVPEHPAGAGGHIMKKLLETFGCHVYGMNLEPTGVFAHKPEPIPEHLGDLCEAVKLRKADLGMNLCVFTHYCHTCLWSHQPVFLS
jgi:hypothetical protein